MSRTEQLHFLNNILLEELRNTVPRPGPFPGTTPPSAACCISTGEFRFLRQDAAKIAANAVTEFLQADISIQSEIS